MALKIVAQEPGDAVWTMSKQGVARVFIVLHDGGMSEMNPGLYLETVKELTPEGEDVSRA